ncbi:MAG: monothiol glutaredoxin grx4 [Chrysothrix sp. TS-e1954]|nr:MAG: monothiol glutaredoxin grx4 [Chrysothrix sp. TS-e1954]
MSKVQPIDDQATFDKHTSSLPSSTLLVTYFHAPWAAPCAQMSTVLDALAATHPVTDPLKISFISINAEELPDISEDHEVSAVPFIVLRRDDKTLDTVSGSDAVKVREAIEKQMNTSSKITQQLPPAQKVTRPAQQPDPLPQESIQSASNLPTASMNGSSAPNTASGAKNLSAYAPSSNDAPTAPAFSSSAMDPSKSNGEAEISEDLNTRLEQLVKAAPAMLFMKGTPSAPQCGFSRQLVSILRENGVRYGFFNILADEEVRQGLKTYADWPTFPQLWLGGDLIGGLDIVKEELDNDSDFFGEYTVDGMGRNKGGPAAPEQQARPTATA